MKKIITLFFGFLISANFIFAAVILPKPVIVTKTNLIIEQPILVKQKPDISKMSIKQLEKLSGKKLNFLQKIVFKLSKHSLKKGSSKISKGLYVVLAILGLGWLAMGILDDWSGNDWIIALVLSLLFWLPGLIYSLVKMKKYYN